MRKLRISPIALLAICVVLVAGCDRNEEPPSPEASPETAADAPVPATEPSLERAQGLFRPLPERMEGDGREITDAMAMRDEATVVAVLKSIPGYAPLFAAAFPDADEPITYENMAEAIGALKIIAAVGRSMIVPHDNLAE